MLDCEELLWKQKSREEWLSLGDRNTRYFHAQASKRRRGNQIKALKLDGDSWTFDEDAIKGAMVEFYRRLYTDDDVSFGSYPFQNDFPIIDDQILEALGSRVSLEEVRNALFQVVPLKTRE